MSGYLVYILECADGTLYTGSTNDLAKRLRAHNGEVPGGARYTSGRRPLKLRYQESHLTKSAALKREHAIKQMEREEKLALFN